jgi:replicative superfamily II helicase
MTGRAGRHKNGGKAALGKAIVLAYSELEREILWQNYIALDKPKAVESSFNSLPLIDWTLDIISSGLASDIEGLNRVFSRTFYMAGNAPFDRLRMTLPASSGVYSEQGRGVEGSEVTPSVPDFESVLETLLELSLVKYTPETGKWAATALGKAAAGSGLSVNETKCFVSKIESGYPQTHLGWLALALSSPEWMPPPGFLSRAEIVHESPLKMLYQHFDSCLEQAGFLLPENHRSEPLGYQTAAALKALLLLDNWGRMQPIQRLEEQFQVHLGQIVSLAETVSHLIKSIAAIVGAREKESPLLEELQDYVFQIRQGVSIEFQPLYQHLNSILNRTDIVSLKEAGIETIVQLCEISEEDLDNSLTNRLSQRKINLLKEKIETIREEEFMSSLNTNTARRMNTLRAVRPGTDIRVSYPVKPESGAIQLLEIDGAADKERYVIRVNGQPLRLTAKSFKYLAKLAWWRAHNPAASGWVYKEDIEVGYNQARYLYRMKNEITDALGFDWPAVENNRLGYYRLNADPEKVRINIANLQNHPDFEIRQMVSAVPAVN